jgi:hypothetical protein
MHLCLAKIASVALVGDDEPQHDPESGAQSRGCSEASVVSNK